MFELYRIEQNQFILHYSYCLPFFLNFLKTHRQLAYAYPEDTLKATGALLMKIY